ncbi:Uncharacterised protein [Legionella busanensis]|uniref:Uncharacterized protein n=1 Tax=Legionella busanensis TaxID=190655 RepID=A0A378JLC7_9GAMM|nr:hypothetical protein [Legionella busanensis]STX52146.1 Uncharacterised protein [Legionella busanensis]
MRSKKELFQYYKSKETKKLLTGNLAYRIKDCLRDTLNNVKFSSNLKPFTPFNVTTDSSDNSILWPTDKHLITWPFFLLNRTVSHTPDNNSGLVTSYKKLPNQKNWQQILRRVNILSNIYFEDKEKQNLFKNLEPRYSKFVQDNIQARSERSGNCIILAHCLFYFLWSKTIKAHDNLIKRIEIVRFKSLDHCFVIVNRNFNSLCSDYKTWNGWIIDPWRGVKGKASILHSDDFLSYVKNLRNFRPDIISSNNSPLEVEVTSGITYINLPKNIFLFKKLDDLIRHGKMEFVGEKESFSKKDLDIHKSKFFAVRKEIELLLLKKEANNFPNNVIKLDSTI